MDTQNRSFLPETGFLRLPQIIGSSTTPPLIPFSRSSFLAGVKDGRYPRSFKLGPRTTAWRVEDIRALIEKLASGGEVQP